MAGGTAQHTNGSKEEGRAGASKLVFPFSLLSLSLKSFGVYSRNVTHSQRGVTLKMLIQVSAKKKDVSRGFLPSGMSGVSHSGDEERCRSQGTLKVSMVEVTMVAGRSWSLALVLCWVLRAL